jgi:hypothetical protein
MILGNTKEEVLNLNIGYLKVNRAIRQNEDKTKKLIKYIEKQEEFQKKYQKMKNEQEKVITSLKGKHKIYQGYLQEVLNKQMKIKDLLGSLNILKKKEIAKEKERIRKAKELARKKALEAKRKREAERKKAAQLAAKKKAAKSKTKKNYNSNKRSKRI